MQQNDLFSGEPGDTLAAAQRRLRAAWQRGITCPCCGQFVKRYRRKLNSGIARSLIHIYHRSGAPGRYVDTAVHKLTGGGDYAKARYWGLLEQAEGRRDDGAKQNGLWRLTRLGWDFVEGNARVQSHALTYNRRCYGLDGNEVTIRDALGSKFDYDELMGES